MYTPFRRETNKKLALILIAIGVVLSPDLIIPTFTDWIDVLIAFPLADVLNITFNIALMLVFLSGFILIAIGILIYPYNSKKLAMAKARAGIQFMSKHPELLILTILILIIMWIMGHFVYQTIYQYAKTLIIGV